MLRLPFGSNVRGKKTPKLAKSPFLSLEDDPGTSGRKLEKARPAETGLAPQSELHLQITSKASRKEELGEARPFMRTLALSYGKSQELSDQDITCSCQKL